MTEANPYTPPGANLEDKGAGQAPPIWNPDAAGAWSLLFTPVFGSVLLRKNWAAMGELSKVKAGTVWLAISVLMLIPTALFPGFGLLYIIVWYFAYQRGQTKYVKARWAKTYPRKPWGAAILGGIGLLVGVYLLTFLIAFVVASAT